MTKIFQLISTIIIQLKLDDSRAIDNRHTNKMTDAIHIKQEKYNTHKRQYINHTSQYRIK